MVSRRASMSGGFTIIEMMVVIAIIGLLLGASTLGLRNVLRSDLRSAASRTAAAMRYCFDRATMTGSYIRLAMDLDKGEAWIEVSADRIRLRSATDRGTQPEEEDREGISATPKARKKSSSMPMMPLLGLGGTEGEDSSGEMGLTIDTAALMEEVEADRAPIGRAKAQFTPIKGELTKKLKLARGIRVAAVTTTRTSEPVEKGMAYIYFFPQGHAEPAIVYLKEERSGDEEYYSVVLHPLTGQARVYSCQVEIPDDFGLPDNERKGSRADPCEGKWGI